MVENVDEDWGPPGAISLAEVLKTPMIPPMMAKFLQGSVTKDGCRLKMVL
jgi:hypothetical protein